MITRADFCKAVDILATERFRGQLNVSGGETTLHPALEAMLTYAAEWLEKACIAVFTNGDWVGFPGWRKRLEALLAGPNVLVRFSLDRQHAEGAVLARASGLDERLVKAVELERLDKARMFLHACRKLGAVPGVNFDFAFKGSLQEGREYTKDLGEVPLYLIRFRRDPSHRRKEFGFLAVDVDGHDSVAVYPTLGHIPTGESLGGLETLAAALEMNRNALSEVRSNA